MERTKLLVLRITDRCNLACKYCYAATREAEDMPVETAKAAIDMFAGPGDKLKIQFTGGEPLLCPKFMEEVFGYVKEKGIQTAFSIQTNGTLIDDRICTLLKKMHCAVGVSLDGMGSANGLRVYPDNTPAFEDTLAGIRTLGRNGIRCNLNAVLSRQNQGRLGELVELAALCGNVHGVGLDTFRPMGLGTLVSYAPVVDTLQKDLEHMLEKQEQLKALGVNVRIKELEKVRSMLRAGVRQGCAQQGFRQQEHARQDWSQQIEGRSADEKQECYCYAGTDISVAADPRGNLFPCASFVGVEDMCMGNVSEKEKPVRKDNMSRIGTLDNRCFTCSDRMICRGGCPAGRIASGGINIADCMMHRVMIQHGKYRNGC